MLHGRLAAAHRQDASRGRASSHANVAAGTTDVDLSGYFEDVSSQERYKTALAAAGVTADIGGV